MKLCILIHSRPASAFFSRRALSIIMDECESLVVMSDNGTMTTWEPLSIEDVLKVTEMSGTCSVFHVVASTNFLL